LLVKDEETARADLHLCIRVDEVHAVHSGRGALVELTRQVLYGEVLLASEVAIICDGVGYGLAEDAVAALLEQFWCKTKEVIHIDIAQRLEVELEIEV
jgi:hypothetical protein